MSHHARRSPGVDPMELLRMINGKVVPTKTVIVALVRSWTPLRHSSPMIFLLG
jgi:hypothetical protein